MARETEAKAAAQAAGGFFRLISRRKSSTMPIEVDNVLVALHAVAALHWAKASQKAIVTIAHPSQSAVLEHAPRMH
jgi:hypothetical protein